MPTYSYACTHCEHTFERFQSMLDEPVKRCPKCRHKVERLIEGGIGIIFKGDGWYCKDSQKKEEKRSVKKEATTEKKTTVEKPKKKEKSAAKSKVA